MEEPVYIFDDHTLFREGLRTMLTAIGFKNIIGCDNDYTNLTRKIRQGEVALLVLDISLGDETPGGLSILQSLREQSVDIKIIMVSMFDNAQFVKQAMELGADAYLTKDVTPEELKSALLRVIGGGRYLPHNLLEKLGLFWVNQTAEPQEQNLSPRELDILHLMCDGQKTSQIASTLHISASTVSTIKRSMKRKLNVSSDMEVLKWAIDNNMTKR